MKNRYSLEIEKSRMIFNCSFLHESSELKQFIVGESFIRSNMLSTANKRYISANALKLYPQMQETIGSAYIQEFF